MIHHQMHNSKENYNYNAYFYTDTSWAPHFHKNFELIYVSEGELFLTVNGVTQPMTTGDYALILSNQIHSFETKTASRCWIAVFAEQFVPHFAHRVETLEGERSVFRCDKAVHDFLQAKLVGASSSIAMKKSCFYAVCDEFARRVPLRERKERSDHLIGNIFDYVAAHYRENITLGAVAEEFGYEYHYLSRLLNRGYRINFSELVNEYRIALSCRLLEETEQSVTEIAMESGFRSIRSFNHVFREVTGKTPSEYKRQMSVPDPVPDLRASLDRARET